MEEKERGIKIVVIGSGHSFSSAQILKAAEDMALTTKYSVQELVEAIEDAVAPSFSEARRSIQELVDLTEKIDFYLDPSDYHPKVPVPKNTTVKHQSNNHKSFGFQYKIRKP